MKTSNKSLFEKRDTVKFIKNVLTPENPLNAYYVNEDELIRQYMTVIFIGMLMILYMVLN